MLCVNSQRFLFHNVDILVGDKSKGKKIFFVKAKAMRTVTSLVGMFLFVAAYKRESMIY